MLVQPMSLCHSYKGRDVSLASESVLISVVVGMSCFAELFSLGKERVFVYIHLYLR